MLPLRPLRRLRRLWNRVLPLVYHRSYRQGISGVPMDPLRGERILAYLLEEGWVGRRQVHAPRAASVENLRRVHSGDYLRSLDDPEEVARIMGLPLAARDAARVVEVQRLMAGGTIQTTRLALRRGGVALHLGGGLHHAGPERGSGFCVLNDVAVAVARLRARGFDEPILVVDLDLHDGNGTRAAFSHDPTVHTFSMHNETWDQVPGAVADTCIAFGPGINDDTCLELLRRELPPVVQGHQPGLVVYVAGADVVRDDAYGDGCMSEEGVLARDRLVVETVRGDRARIPLAIVLGGGYGASAWRLSARLAGWICAGRSVTLPDDLTAALDRVRWVEEEGEATDRDTAGDPFAWSLSEADLMAVGGAPDRERLLLGRYSRSQVEAQLSRFGILEQARVRGYRSPVVEVQPSSGLGPTVRLYADEAREALLLEVRLDVDRATIPGMALLKVEWLLLQDPRAEFRRGRPALPGQRHPGLGCLADVVAWLVTLCRDEGLDGLSFRSSHFHIAVLAERHLRFVREADRRRFEWIRQATSELGLGEAARAVDEGRLVDTRTGKPVRWSDVLMVVPVSPALKGALDGRTDDQAAASADAAGPGPYRLAEEDEPRKSSGGGG